VELPVPSPKSDEVLVRTAATTICTSDIVDMTHNPFGTPLPKVLGHEGAGTVVAIGTEVHDFRVGDRVAAHPVISCYTCATCRMGLPHLCEQMGHLGVDRDGTFAEYFRIPARRVRRLPDSVDSAVGALLEPVCVCLEGVRRTRLSAGESLLIAGDGPFGLLMARLALKERPGRLILVGGEDFRLGQLPEATTIHAGRTPDVPAAVRTANGDRDVDTAILAVASAEALDACLQSLRPRGRLAIFAGITEPVPVDLFRLHLKELEMLGACNDEDYIDEALALVADPSLKLDRLVTHRLPFAAWREAIELAAHRKDQALKVAITFGEEAP
jgi:threonine dehydrogenase-like Zn-dependent dehydrogenase